MKNCVFNFDVPMPDVPPAGARVRVSSEAMLLDGGLHSSSDLGGFDTWVGHSGRSFPRSGTPYTYNTIREGERNDYITVQSILSDNGDLSNLLINVIFECLKF